MSILITFGLNKSDIAQNMANNLLYEVDNIHTINIYLKLVTSI